MSTPQDAFDGLFQLGLELGIEGEVEQSLECYAKCLSLTDDKRRLALAINNCFACLDRLGYTDLDDLVAAGLELDPECPELWSAAGKLQEGRHNYLSAVRLYSSALVHKPHLTVTGFNLGLICLMHGDFNAGLALYELRFAM